jgi:hypothetical protein
MLDAAGSAFAIAGRPSHQHANERLDDPDEEDVVVVMDR